MFSVAKVGFGYVTEEFMDLSLGEECVEQKCFTSQPAGSECLWGWKGAREFHWGKFSESFDWMSHHQNFQANTRRLPGWWWLPSDPFCITGISMPSGIYTALCCIWDRHPSSPGVSFLNRIAAVSMFVLFSCVTQTYVLQAVPIDIEWDKYQICKGCALVYPKLFVFLHNHQRQYCCIEYARVCVVG